MKNLKEAQNNLHAQYCRARNLHYVIQSNDLEIAYIHATPEKRLIVLKLITTGDLSAIRRFIKKELLELTPFHRMRVTQLRKIGKRLHIENYHIIRKQILVERINDEVKRIKANSKRVALQSQ